MTWRHLGKLAAKQQHRQRQPAGDWAELTFGKIRFHEKEWDAVSKQ